MVRSQASAVRSGQHSRVHGLAHVPRNASVVLSLTDPLVCTVERGQRQGQRLCSPHHAVSGFLGDVPILATRCFGTLACVCACAGYTPFHKVSVAGEAPSPLATRLAATRAVFERSRLRTCTRCCRLCSHLRKTTTSTQHHPARFSGAVPRALGRRDTVSRGRHPGRRPPLCGCTSAQR